MKSIQTSIRISAAPSIVWKALMDFEKYPEWNPFIHISGQAQKGSRLKNTIFLEGQKPQVFKPEVLEVEQEKSFRWLGHLFIAGLFDGEHSFRLEADANGGTILHHNENFKGILSGLILKMIKTQTQEGFEKMNQALKEYCERYR